ncbi:MAG: amino acid permease [Fimbriimonadaceae bacterium]
MAERPHLDRVLGPVSATCIVIGAIIGVGIFLSPGKVVRLTGEPGLAMWAWIIGGAIAMLGALTFAELGGMYTRSGAHYAALRDSYGPLGGFLYVFCNSTAIQCGGAVIMSLVCANNLCFMLDGASDPGSMKAILIASALIVALSVNNIVGVRFGATIQNVTVFSKVLTLVGIIVIAAFFEPSSPAPVVPLAKPEGSPALLLFAGLIPVLFAFGGWQHALWIGGEIRDPKRNIPFALIGGVGIVIVVYLLANWAYLHLLGAGAMAITKTIAADAVGRVVPENAARMVAGLVAVSAFGVLNASYLSSPRLLYGMARDGRFFSPFAKVHARFHTPYWSITLIAGLGLVMLWLAKENGVDFMLTGVVMVEAIFMLLTGLAVIVLRSRRPDAERPVRVLLYPVVPVLFVVGECLVVIGSFLDEPTRNAAWIGIVWLVVAAVVYFVFFRGRPSLNALEETGDGRRETRIG